MKQYKVISLTLIGFFLLSQLPIPVKAISNEIKSIITLSVFVGKNKFNLYGYTTPRSKVYLTGLGIEAQTTSNNEGYFEFSGIFSPLEKREICLYSLDNSWRRSYPICLPPFPIKYSVNIGPVLLPPTISANYSNALSNNRIVISGQSIPKSQVYLSFFSERENNLTNLYSNNPSYQNRLGIKIPEIPATSDNKGNYSVVLPSRSNEIMRVFSRTKFNQASSPNSNRLTISISVWWLYLLQILLAILTKFSNFVVFIIICGETMLLIYLLKPYFNNDRHLDNIKGI